MAKLASRYVSLETVNLRGNYTLVEFHILCTCVESILWVDVTEITIAMGEPNPDLLAVRCASFFED